MVCCGYDSVMETAALRRDQNVSFSLAYPPIQWKTQPFVVLGEFLPVPESARRWICLGMEKPQHSMLRSDISTGGGDAALPSTNRCSSLVGFSCILSLEHITRFPPRSVAGKCEADIGNQFHAALTVDETSFHLGGARAE